MNKTCRAFWILLSGLAVTVLAGSSFAAAEFAKTPSLVSKYHFHDDDKDDDEEIPFDEAEIFFELNNSDGDLGIHALIDGEGWKRLSIENPRERKMLGVWVMGRLRRQGLTEIFFESAEPTFDELDPGRFFRRFPEGEYEIEGNTLDWQELESVAELTHVMPAPAKPTVNGESLSENCDDEDPGYAPTEVSDEDGITIAWPAVTMSHPDVHGGGAGVQPPVEVAIVNYEVVLEVEAENPEDEEDTYESIFSIKLPHWLREVTIPEQYIDQGDTFKYEVLAREESYNQTAVESCFVLVE
jgi:hypothetical protein